MRGQASVIIAAVFFSLLLILVIPLILSMFYTASSRQPTYENPVYKSLLVSLKSVSQDITAFYNASNSTLLISNTGGNDIRIEKAILYISCLSGSTYTNYYINTKTGLVIQSGKTVQLQINTTTLPCSKPITKSLYLITGEGTVISAAVLTPQDLQAIGSRRLNTTLPASPTAAETILPVAVSAQDTIWNISILKQKGFEIDTLDSMTSPTKIVPYTDLSKGMKGGTTTTYIWKLQDVFSKTSISISNQNVRCIWIGYDPRNTSRYNIIITAPPSIQMSIGGKQYSPGTGTYTRIKIYGFTPRTSSGILRVNDIRLGNTWITKPDQDIAEYTFLLSDYSSLQAGQIVTLDGTADRIEVYTRVTGTESGYNPYTMFMNTDGSRAAGILFTTIDRIYGNQGNRNDRLDTYSYYDSRYHSLVDYSTYPLALVYKGFAVSNANSSAVVIAVNYRFHDNEGADADGVTEDRPIMFVGLVDESGYIYSYRSYTFRELTRYEDTYPPTAQAQSSLVFIPLPPRDQGVKKFYVFIAMQDPYSYNSDDLRDDLDFTLFIESLTVLPMG